MSTPSSISSKQFVSQPSLRYGKYVSVAWAVPNIVAIRTFLDRDSNVSSFRATQTDKLQKPLFLNFISPHALHPNSSRVLRSGMMHDLLNIPRSPVPDFAKFSHSSIKIRAVGFSSNTQLLFDIARCGCSRQNSPVLHSAISLSSKSLNDNRAARRTPPTCTIQPQ